MLSVVVPCFNEEAVIRSTHERLARVLDALDVPSEIVYVDDGSRDATFSLLATIQARDYVRKDEGGRTLRPTQLGFLVTDLLVQN